MPRVRINDGDLLSGTGVEGRRKRKRRDDPPAPEEQPKKVEQQPRKTPGGEPLFGDDEDADIFYTKKK